MFRPRKVGPVKLAPTATIFLAGLQTSSALHALSLARAAAHRHGWSNETQQEVARQIIKTYGERKLRRLQERRVHG